MKVLERNIQIRKTSLKDESDDLKNTTAAERWAMMWQLALDAWAFKGKPIAEPRLQRNIVRVYRRKSSQKHQSANQNSTIIILAKANSFQK